MLKKNQERMKERVKKELMSTCPFGAIVDGKYGLGLSGDCRMCRQCVKKHIYPKVTLI
jgi:hypothetical protein